MVTGLAAMNQQGGGCEMINHVVLKKIRKLCDDLVIVDFEGSHAGSTAIDRSKWDISPLGKT